MGRDDRTSASSSTSNKSFTGIRPSSLHKPGDHDKAGLRDRRARFLAVHSPSWPLAPGAPGAPGAVSPGAGHRAVAAGGTANPN